MTGRRSILAHSRPLRLRRTDCEGFYLSIFRIYLTIGKRIRSNTPSSQFKYLPTLFLSFPDSDRGIQKENELDYAVKPDNDNIGGGHEYFRMPAFAI